MDRYNAVFKSLFLGKLLIFLAYFLVFISPVSGQIGHNVLYSLSQNVFGINVYNYSDSKMDIGAYGELKGVLSDPRTKQSGETIVFASAGLVMQMGTNIIAYLGAGPSWRGYYEGKWGMIDPAKLNITCGIIVTNLGSRTFFRRLSYQIGVDTRPFGMNIGIGLHFNLPFLKRSR